MVTGGTSLRNGRTSDGLMRTFEAVGALQESLRDNDRDGICGNGIRRGNAWATYKIKLMISRS